MSDGLADVDAIGQAELVRRKQVSPLELAEAAISRIERINPDLNAVITPLFDKARARAATGSLPDGPFKGVPFLVKDLMSFSAGDPMYNGMRLLRDARFVAPHDSYVIARFKAAGFVCLGKTNAPELGLTATTEPEAFGPTRNPWRPDRSSGGSSGGSAAAVASRMVAIAHGNDGGGSIRIPASECGLVGLKASRGRVSWGPDMGDALHGFATEGALTRTVRDAAAVLDAIAGTMPGDPYAAPAQARAFAQEVGVQPPPLRIGFMSRSPHGGAPLHPDCVAAVEEAARLLGSLGHVVEQSHPAALDESECTGHFTDVFACHGALAVLQIGIAAGRKLSAEDVEPWTWALAERGFTMSAAQYLAAVQWLQVWARRVTQWWSEGYDLLLTPTLAKPPPPLGALATARDSPATGWKRLMELVQFTPQFNVTGQPAISLPLYWNADQLPIGVQLVSAFGREDMLIQIASQLEQARPWKDRRPPICA